jgi:hypothetical protein
MAQQLCQRLSSSNPQVISYVITLPSPQSSLLAHPFHVV